MKMQKISAVGALVFFLGAGLFALLNVQDRERDITANRAQLQSDCVRKCAPRSASVVDIRRFPTRPETLRGNHIVESKCECN